MTCYFANGNTFTPADETSLNIHKTLPAGNYIIKQNPQNMALYFERVEDFPAPKKIYGDLAFKAEKILNTYESRSGSTGVLLAGDKGSGKTMLAKLLARSGQKSGYPTIIVNQPWHGDGFNQLIQGVNQPAVVLFDEFEKVYDRKIQQSVLTLLDGVFPTRKLFILTINDTYAIDSHMRNRPGRLFYFLEYRGLKQAFIREYCQDALKNRDHTESVCRAALLFDEFSFDALQALCEEMNRYNEPALAALEMLNIKIGTFDERGVNTKHNLQITKPDGDIIPLAELEPEYLYQSPLAMETIDIEWSNPGGEKGKDRTFLFGESTLKFEPDDLKTIDVENGRFVYENQKGFVAVFTRNNRKTEGPNYGRFLKY